MTSEKPTELVHAFFADLAQGRVDAALDRVDEQIVYTNVSLPTVRGKQRFASVMRALNGKHIAFDAAVLAISADDDGVVLTERIDELTVGPLRIQFWVCGRNEVREGRIALWRDYFDFWNCTRGFVRAVAALVVPGLHKPLPNPVSGAV
ncbi:limonene-1,2-epoxide hydrolase family protein [Gordonia phthalatica]|uniref:Limonene-1,2-epoxide hydrolase n=1 Tax=Gordonia phthalatica TaxID=1136941 RepID=A0A0N9N7F6_9ACTN|nr:limonene-1,2-epoxide hydrolase family protein [Gordonia phthalatica]ALG83938.1 limonene-1,2-epoxide hydrolase [Gordonia phthalatica]